MSFSQLTKNMLNKSLPKQIDATEVRFYLAEDFREEKDGKISAISLFTEPKVLMQIPSNQPDPTPDSPAALHALSFLFNVAKAPLGALVSIDLKVPTGTQSIINNQLLPSPSVTDGSANFIMRMMPCVVTALGKQTFTITVNSRKFEFDFSIERQDRPTSADDTSSPPAKSVSKIRSKKVPK